MSKNMSYTRRSLRQVFLILPLSLLLLVSCTQPKAISKEAYTLEGWASQDIGSVALPGKVTATDKTITVLASGEDIWSSKDSFHFLHQTLAGDGTIISQISNLKYTDDWAKAGLMMRESLEEASPFVFMTTTPVNGNWFMWRGKKAESSDSFAGAELEKANWLKLERSSDIFSGYQSVDGTTWLPVFSKRIDLPETLHIGMAVTSRNNSVQTEAVFEALAVTKTAVEKPSDPEPEPEPEPEFPVQIFKDFLIDLESSKVPEEISYNVYLDSVSKAQSVLLSLTAYDPDYPDEGELYINGNGPIPLFGDMGKLAFNEQGVTVAWSTPIAWWKQGDNKLRFVHVKTNGFSLTAGQLQLSSSVASDVPDAKPEPEPEPEPTPTPEPEPEPAPNPQPSGASEGFPVVMTSSVSEAKAAITLTKPADRSTAEITLVVIDPDFADEGELYINGNGPVKLFGEQASTAHNDKTLALSFAMPASWWQSGKNNLTFKRIQTTGYTIEKAEVSFSNKAIPTPAPTPEPAPTPAPEPTPAPTPEPEPEPEPEPAPKKKSDLLPQPKLPAIPSKATYYVSTSGSDRNSGREGSPFRTIGKAIDLARAGDVVFVRGGRYTNEELRFTRSGTSGSPITIMSYPGEWAVIDWSNKRGGSDKQRIWVDGADYIVMRNMEIYRSPAQGVFLFNGANNNVFVGMVFNNNYLSGFQIFGGSRNIVAYSVSKDSYGGDDSDGFGSLGQGGSSDDNEFWYNLSDHNADDGFDTWKGRRTILFGNVSRNNGYNGGDGNGFKMGGQQADANGIIRRNIAYNNNRVGFDTNLGGGNLIENNTAFANKRHNFESSRTSNDNTWRNNLSVNGSIGMYADTIEQNNSWNLGIKDAGLLSTSTGSGEFLALRNNSPVIDRGRGVNIPYAGSAPDLGALELGLRIGDLLP